MINMQLLIDQTQADNWQNLFSHTITGPAPSKARRPRAIIITFNHHDVRVHQERLCQRGLRISLQADQIESLGITPYKGFTNEPVHADQ